MRDLSRKQKNMLRKFIRNEYFENGIEPPMFFSCDKDMPPGLYWLIYRMNEHECFNSNVDRFVSDIRCVDDCRII